MSRCFHYKVDYLANTVFLFALLRQNLELLHPFSNDEHDELEHIDVTHV